MAYMHKDTFDISIENSCVKNPDDWFEIDDIIALPVQALNRKGYITKHCCSGHAFGSVVEDNYPEFPDDIYQYTDNVSYISFKKGVSLPSLPPEFHIVSRTREDDASPWIVLDYTLIYSKEYENPECYGTMRHILEVMEQLYEWALNLPEFKC
jgi:hypothetical protein